MRDTGRFTTVSVAALAILLASVGVAFAAQTQTVDMSVSPRKLPKIKTAPVAVKVHTTTTDPDSPNGVPVAATRALLHFDDDIRFVPKVAGQCTVAKLNGKDTAGAKAACPTAIVGGGTAVALLPTGDTTHEVLGAEVTVFNKRPESYGPDAGKPAVILYSYVPRLLYGQPLVGVLKTSGLGGDYGRVLDVTIPPLPANAALVDFNVTVGNGFKRGYVRARCHDRSRRLNVKARFIFANATSLWASDYSVCRRR